MSLALIQQLTGGLCIATGLVFMFLGSVGILRLPDFYARTHAAGKVDTVGIIVVLLGIATLEGVTINSAKIGVAIIFLTVTNPVAVHALARAAMRHGFKPWQRKDRAGKEC